MVKRLFDIVFSSLLLIATLPLLVFIAIWIYSDSPGPVFYLQKRVGQGGKYFYIFKFRTMRHNKVQDSQDPLITIGKDSRITRSGSFLRRFKLDELPQFLNVLRNEMSIVGPRPEVPEYVNLYPENLRLRVLSIKPGITDIASIVMRNESDLLASSKDPMEFYVKELIPLKLAYCDYYLVHKNLAMDLSIIALTVLAALSIGMPVIQKYSFLRRVDLRDICCSEH